MDELAKANGVKVTLRRIPRREEEPAHLQAQGRSAQGPLKYKMLIIVRKPGYENAPRIPSSSTRPCIQRRGRNITWS
jgi:hypothetical protein